MAANQNLNEQSDQELVHLTLENQDNFLYIVNRYEKKLLSFILRISNVNYQDAQDLLQEIFIKVYQNLNDYDPELKFSSWIYRITRNHVISHYRKNKNKPQVLPFELEQDLFETLAADFDLGQTVETKLTRERIFAALDKLKPKYREVIVLRYFEEKSYDEISDIIKKPTGTVGTMINRAKKQFKEKFIY
ncbi:MAG: RNA polymerase sigma factor [Patescibacteria group bacterium]|jgi:RNA polymerase sigma-70 factor (ECF subfamily)|nr:RNA polymerase sigma factor [Patescibacteria group bacterium]